MAKNRTEKSRFESGYGGGWIAAPQYLAEEMCRRKAKKDSRSLSQLFWQSGEWKREFLLQVRHANSLLKVYEFDAVKNALKSPSGKKIWSLGFKNLDPMIQAEQEKLNKIRIISEREKVVEKPTEILPAQENSQRPKFSFNKNTLSKLKDL